MPLFISNKSSFLRYLILAVIITFSLTIVISCTNNSNSTTSPPANEISTRLTNGDSEAETDSSGSKISTPISDTDNLKIAAAVKLTDDNGKGLDAYYDAIEAETPIFLYFYTYT